MRVDEGRRNSLLDELREEIGDEHGFALAGKTNDVLMLGYVVCGQREGFPAMPPVPAEPDLGSLVLPGEAYTSRRPDHRQGLAARRSRQGHQWPPRVPRRGEGLCLRSETGRR